MTRASCQKEFLARCVSRCAAEDAACRASCTQRAPQFCKKRQRRKVIKTAETVAKGGTLAIGAVAVIVQNRMDEGRAEEGGASGQRVKPSPYSIIWDDATLLLEGGGGLLFGGVGLGTAHLKLRKGSWGVTGVVSHMRQGGDTLTELDVGPTYFMHSRTFIFGAQPSVLVSAGNDTRRLIGGGLRTYTDMILGRAILSFDPMLGYINGQWNYHMRLGLAWRFTPRLFARVAYDWRDILDLNDLDISQASLHGVTGLVGFRFN